MTAEEQAAHLAGMMEAMAVRRQWWTKTFWYDSHRRDEGLLGPDGEANRGQPFPVFHRYAAVIQDVDRA